MLSPRTYRPRSQSPRRHTWKRNLRRFTILLAFAFVLFQLKLAGSPVQLYMQVMGDAASPPLSFSGNSISAGNSAGDMIIEGIQNGQVFLRTIPVRAGVRVWQDNNCLGDIPASGQAFSVKPGRILLDARGLGQGISVEIYYLGQKYTINMTEEIKAFDIN